jgi:hypothetical protein
MPYMIEHSDFVTLAALGSGRGVSRAQKLHAGPDASLWEYSCKLLNG